MSIDAVNIFALNNIKNEIDLKQRHQDEEMQFDILKSTLEISMFLIQS